jgi:hypothetical protein
MKRVHAHPRDFIANANLRRVKAGLKPIMLITVWDLALQHRGTKHGGRGGAIRKKAQSQSAGRCLSGVDGYYPLNIFDLNHLDFRISMS